LKDNTQLVNKVTSGCSYITCIFTIQHKMHSVIAISLSTDRPQVYSSLFENGSLKAKRDAAE